MTTIRNVSRTWNVTIVDRLDGAVIGIDRHVITMSTDAAGNLSATVDGQPAHYLRAHNLLKVATRVEVAA